jgi:hypothetical protein
MHLATISGKKIFFARKKQKDFRNGEGVNGESGRIHGVASAMELQHSATYPKAVPAIYFPVSGPVVISGDYFCNATVSDPTHRVRDSNKSVGVSISQNNLPDVGFAKFYHIA